MRGGDAAEVAHHRLQRQCAFSTVGGAAWFAVRPSGTEDVYKVYAESFRGPDHLAEVQREAREVVSAALAG